MNKLAIFLADGFEEIEGLTVVDLCRRAGLPIDMISIKDSVDVMGSHKIPVRADLTMAQIDWDSYDVLILPGGKLGTDNLEACEELKQHVLDFDRTGRETPSGQRPGKYLAAICAAPRIFGHMGLLKGRRATSYPTFESHLEGAIVRSAQVEHDGHIITGQGMGAATAFALELVATFAGREVSDKIAGDIVYLPPAE